MKIVGIDPGVSGGFAWFDGHGRLHVEKMPVTERDIYDVFAKHLSPPSFALIEDVHSSPVMRPRDAFTFGANIGFLRACLISLGIPFDQVRPQVWQKAIGCLSKGDKNVTKAKAQQLFPEIKFTHYTADAALIAEYLKRIQKAIPHPPG